MSGLWEIGKIHPVQGLYTMKLKMQLVNTP